MANPPSKEKLVEFLKLYAEILRTGVDITNDLPLSIKTEMPAGCIRILTKDGHHIASVGVEGDITSPSTPVGPATMTYAKLFVELANKKFS